MQHCPLARIQQGHRGQEAGRSAGASDGRGPSSRFLYEVDVSVPKRMRGDRAIAGLNRCRSVAIQRPVASLARHHTWSPRGCFPDDALSHMKRGNSQGQRRQNCKILLQACTSWRTLCYTRLLLPEYARICTATPKAFSRCYLGRGRRLVSPASGRRRICFPPRRRLAFDS